MNSMVRFVTTNDLIDTLRPDPLIDGFIQEQDAVVLYSEPNAGKSFVALDWALCVATGKPWLDSYEVKKGPVVYMAGEGGASLQVRVQAWMKYHQVSEIPGAYFQTRPLPIREEEVIEEIQEVIQSFAKHERGAGDAMLQPRLIVVDTLSQFMMGGDENGPDMALFVSNLRRLSQDVNTAVLIVHHTNKGGQSERGHTALRGNTDAMFKCVPIYQDHLLVGMDLSNDKQRDKARAAVLNLKFKKIPLGVDQRGREIDSLVVLGTASAPSKLPTVKRTLLAVLNAMLQTEDLKTERCIHTDLTNYTGIDRSNLHRYLGKLEELKCAKRGIGKSYLTPIGRAVLKAEGMEREEPEKDDDDD